MFLTFANKITIGRIIAVPFFIAIILFYSPEKDYLRYVALGLFLLAVLSDMLDGYIARIKKQETSVGAILDPLADKFLILSAYICLHKISVYFDVVKLPLWLVVSVIVRDLVLIVGSVILNKMKRNLEIKPTVLGKATVFFQILSILGFLLQIPVSVYVWYLTVILTVVSGVDYFKTGVFLLTQRKMA